MLLTLGGTIESHYNPEEGTPEMVPLKMGSVIPRALEKLGLEAECELKPICLKDSKDVTSLDLQQALSAIANFAGNKVIVVQGTDTMPDNARWFESQLEAQELKDKTVIFTGAMQPLRDKEGALRPQADGWDCLKLAFNAARQQPAGCFVAIEGAVHYADAILKYVKSEEGQVIESRFVPRLLGEAQEGRER